MKKVSLVMLSIGL